MSTLAELRDLPADWHGPESCAMSEEALRTAGNLTFVPLTSGGIQIEMHAGGMDVEIEIARDGSVSSIFTEVIRSPGATPVTVVSNSGELAGVDPEAKP